MLHSLIPPHSTIIVGLSGGPDSVYLLHKLVELSKDKNLKLIIAHLDHEWRPDSAQDVSFCKKLAKQFKLPFVTKKLSDIARYIKDEGSKEAYGRAARRHFLESVQKEYGADAIALAHHAQDQQENFFIRLLRGSSLDGLVGIKPQEGSYIRPLLSMDKKDIVTYLDEQKIPYLTDPSNESKEFLRNRIRAQVIPALRSVDARFDTNFSTTLARLKEANEYLQQETEKIFATLCTVTNGTYQLNIPSLLGLDPYMQQRVVLHWLISQNVPFTPTYRFLQEILRFLRQPGSKEHQIHHAWKIVKKKENAFIRSI